MTATMMRATASKPQQASLTWQEVKDRTYKVDTQTAQLRLRLKFQMYIWHPGQGPANKFLLVSTEGSEVNPGKLHWNRDDKRGYYTESVRVRMGFDTTPAGVSLYSDAPPTNSMNATESSSVSESLSGGFFGGDPTGSLGLTISNSFSVSLSDYKVINTSTGTQVDHLIKMAASKGGPYDKPQDLVDMSAGGQFTGTMLHHLPDRATSNLSLVSQGLWRTATPINDTLQFRVEVDHVLCAVEKTFKVFTVDIQHWNARADNVYTFPIDFSQAGD